LARDTSLRINGCTHGGSIAWHMVPRSNQLLHAIQHRLARDALLQNQWLHAWQQRCLARDASLRINGCTHGGSIAWHMVPRSNQLLHAMQHRLALDASLQNQWPRLRIKPTRAWPEAPSAPAWTGLDADACWVNIHALLDSTFRHLGFNVVAHTTAALLGT
tara:strand:+ start:167 stop:649 length:483 start_codon:yes stop_codon:yes gene_type:complete